MKPSRVRTLAKTCALLGALGCGCAEMPEPTTGQALEIQQGNCMVLVPPSPAEEASSSEVTSQALPVRLCAAMQVLYVHFDGQTFVGASKDEILLGRSILVGHTRGVGMEATIPAYTGGTVRKAEIMKRVRKYLARFSIEIVDKRPPDDSYTTIVVGGRGANLFTDERVVTGVAPLDCDNASQVGIGFVFAEDIGTTNIDQIAESIAHESSHMFGLLHVTSSKDVMFKGVTTDPQLQAFVDETLRVDFPQQTVCNGRAEQNSFRHLATHLPVCPGQPDPSLVDAAAPMEVDAMPDEHSDRPTSRGGDPEGTDGDDDSHRELVERKAADSGGACKASLAPSSPSHSFGFAVPFLGAALALFVARRRLSRRRGHGQS